MNRVRRDGLAVIGTILAISACGQAGPDNAQPAPQDAAEIAADLAPDAAALADASSRAGTADLTSASVVHFEATGVLTDPHVQIPAADADQYGDVIEKVTLSFDWNKDTLTFVGVPEIRNEPATVTNLVGMDTGCPGGELKGPYEHFDITELKAEGDGAIQVFGVRKHPDTMVAESCGAGRRLYAAADVPQTMWIAPPDPAILEIAAMLPADGGVTASPDGKSIVMTALNDNWVWTYTPSVK